MKIGILFRPGSLWIGGHYSSKNRRWCVNLVPCVTVWVVRKGGVVPRKHSTNPRAAGIALAEAFDTARIALTPATLKAVRDLVACAIDKDLSLEEFKFLYDEILQEAP